jgi:hypothetical protein
MANEKARSGKWLSGLTALISEFQLGLDDPTAPPPRKVASCPGAPRASRQGTMMNIDEAQFVLPSLTTDQFNTILTALSLYAQNRLILQKRRKSQPWPTKL